MFQNFSAESLQKAHFSVLSSKALGLLNHPKQKCMYLLEYYFFYNYRNLLCHKKKTKNKTQNKQAKTLHKINPVEYSTRDQQKLENFSSILTSMQSQEISITTNIRESLSTSVLHGTLYLRKSTSYLFWPLCKYFSNKTKAIAFLLILRIYK